MRCATLAEWLSWQQGLHPSAIDLGLERVRQVLRQLDWQPPDCPVITIAGTKGKGSSAALLQAVYTAAGYRTGLFTSPHLLRYNERIVIAGQQISDAQLCALFAQVDAARGDISLTYFEFNTLAALLAFRAANLDVWLLEVGMGGRLDAVNVVDADVALITAIGLDHTEWLGNDLNSIAREKAGIMRAGRPVIFGALQMPAAIAEVAASTGARLLRAGVDFHHQPSQPAGSSHWSWQSGSLQLADLPLPGLPGVVQLANASAVLAVTEQLQSRLPVTVAQLHDGLVRASIAGRLQLLRDANGHEWLLDVAHNALSAEVLAAHLATLPARPTLAVLGLMADKDLAAMVSALSPHVSAWLPVALPGDRALPVAQLATRLADLRVSVLPSQASVTDACVCASHWLAAGVYQRVLVSGSFLTVGPALHWLGSQ